MSSLNAEPFNCRFFSPFSLWHREHEEIRRNTQAKTPQAKTLAPTEENIHIYKGNL